MTKWMLIGLALATAGAAIAPSSVLAQDASVPVFRVTVVAHTTQAINYRPRRGDTKIDFVGTVLMLNAKGSAEVSGEQGYMKIQAKFDKLAAPKQFGPEYLTYVLWAVTPEGRATNLGEVQVEDDDSKVEVTTELQAFGLIVTAEPYFAVTQPSDAVVMENVARESTNGKVELIEAKHELLKRGSYLMNQHASQLKIKPIEPGTPADLAQARNAIALARVASADRFAGETFTKAEGLLVQAETAKENKKGGNDIMMPARQAVQTAEDARLVGLKRQEEAWQAEQRNASAAREASALVTASAERERAQAEAQRRQAAETTAVAARNAVERERANAAAAVAQSDAARRAAEAKAGQATAAALTAEQEKAALRDLLRSQLNKVLETRESARGLIVNMSDVLFDTGSATLKPGAREKLSRIAGILTTHPDLRLTIEGHTDSQGGAEYNQQLSQKRADSVRSYLVGQKVPAASIGTEGFGEDRPVASNDTASGRQQNRRVEVVVSGEAIASR